MEDTIAAIATAYGEGGIGIVRISGPASYNVLMSVFQPIHEIELEPRKLTYGYIMNGNELVDEVMAVYMNGPKTYTVENSAEIYCHGSIVSLRKTLALVLKNGARMAEPGEFTKRAFLNGRIDLSQAEAVIDLISAKTDKTFEIALKQLDGALSLKISSLRQNLVDILVNVTVNIDYPDEDIEVITFDKLVEDLSFVKNDLSEILSSSCSGKILREGLKVSIVGKPNVGKSSLMNALLRQNRAIVTEIPGTTRDTIEEELSIRGIPVILTDTAGIRDTDDVIERIGIEKSKQSFNDADLIIFIIDGSEALSTEDYDLMGHIGNRKCIVLINKGDLGVSVDLDEVRHILPNATLIHSSILQSYGLDEIEDIVESFVYGGFVYQKDSLVVTNVRHSDLLRQADECITDAIAMANVREPLEFIEIDIHRCYDLLGEILGETVSDDIISEVFSRFCLGK